MHGAAFGEKRSGDYGAVMNYARVTPPAVKENYVDIAGGDSAIDRLTLSSRCLTGCGRSA